MVSVRGVLLTPAAPRRQPCPLGQVEETRDVETIDRANMEAVGSQETLMKWVIVTEIVTGNESGISLIERRSIFPLSTDPYR